MNFAYSWGLRGLPVSVVRPRDISVSSDGFVPVKRFAGRSVPQDLEGERQLQLLSEMGSLNFRADFPSGWGGGGRRKL